MPPKALPALGSHALGGSPSPLQHLQGQAEEKALESHSHPTSGLIAHLQPALHFLARANRGFQSPGVLFNSQHIALDD